MLKVHTIPVTPLLLLLHQVIDGYFVHYFAPSGLQPVNKNVLFVLDRSGSMSGKKIQQTKEAMVTILRDLRPGDLFNIIYFSDYLRWWSADAMMEVSEDNIKDAEEFVMQIDASGGILPFRVVAVLFYFLCLLVSSFFFFFFFCCCRCILPLKPE